jgi:hypothetical protein
VSALDLLNCSPGSSLPHSHLHATLASLHARAYRETRKAMHPYAEAWRKADEKGKFQIMLVVKEDVGLNAAYDVLDDVTLARQVTLDAWDDAKDNALFEHAAYEEACARAAALSAVRSYATQAASCAGRPGARDAIACLEAQAINAAVYAAKFHCGAGALCGRVAKEAWLLALTQATAAQS